MTGSAMTVYLPRDLRDKVVRLSDAQNRSASSVIAEAVRLRFAKRDEAPDAASRHGLARIEQRLDKAIRDGVLVKECVLLFVRVWLEHNPPLDEEIEESAAASAAARFERFLDVIASGIDGGRSLAFFKAPPAHVIDHDASSQGQAT